MFKSNPQEIDIPIKDVEIHSKVINTLKEKNTENLERTMKMVGQLTPVFGNLVDGKFFITDGCARYKAAQNIGLKTIRCIPINIPDEEIIKMRMISNQRVKRSYIEMASCAEHILQTIGSTQGKKKEEWLGMDNLESDDNYGLAGKDRFELASILLDLPIKSSTLRKLMAVYWHNQIDNSLGLMDGIDSNLYSIDQAYRLIKKDEKIQEKNAFKEWRNNEISNQAVWSKVFHQSSDNLSNLKKYRPNFAMFSPTYWTMKDYRNQGEMKFGQEPTLEEYLNNCKKFILSLIEIMDENGVIVIVIGESFSGGYKSILAKYEMMLIDTGLELLGVCEWVKSNPSPVVVENFYRPANEKIFVCKMKNANVVFNPKMKMTKEGKKMVKKSHKSKDGSNRFFVQDEETVISNIITTPVFNNSEYKKYDPNFTHDAPCPMEIYDILTQSYTLPGMTCIDIHCGAGQGLEVFAKNGCNSIGVDIDIESVEFCRKRMDMVLGPQNQEELLQVA